MPVYEGTYQVYTEALGVFFPVDSMDSCEEMMIQDWPGIRYNKLRKLKTAQKKT